MSEALASPDETDGVEEAPAARSPADSTSSSGARDFAIAAALAVVYAGLCALLFQRKLFSDGSLIYLVHQSDFPPLATAHKAYHVLIWVLRAAGLELELALRIATIAPAALALGILYLALRNLGTSRFAALAGAVLTASCHSVLFSSTSIEAHGVQLLGACAGFALLTPFLRPIHGAARGWGGVAVALVCGAASLAILAVTHPSNLLVAPGVALLTFPGLQRAGLPWRRLGAVLAIGVLIALPLGAWFVSYYLAGYNIDLDRVLSYFAKRGFPPSWTYLKDTFALPFGPLFAMAPFGFLVGVGSSRLHALGAAAWVLSPLLMLTWWETPDGREYFLAAVPALAWIAVAALEKLPSRLRFAAPLLALAAFAYSIERVRDWDQPPGEEAERWLEGLSRAGGDEGILLAYVPEHLIWAAHWSPLHYLDLKILVFAPEAEQDALLDQMMVFVFQHGRRGVPIFVDYNVASQAHLSPIAAEMMRRLHARFELEEVHEGEFHALRGQRMR